MYLCAKSHLTALTSRRERISNCPKKKWAERKTKNTAVRHCDVTVWKKPLFPVREPSRLLLPMLYIGILKRVINAPENLTREAFVYRWLLCGYALMRIKMNIILKDKVAMEVRAWLTSATPSSMLLSHTLSLSGQAVNHEKNISVTNWLSTTENIFSITILQPWGAIFICDHFIPFIIGCSLAN